MTGNCSYDISIFSVGCFQGTAVVEGVRPSSVVLSQQLRPGSAHLLMPMALPRLHLAVARVLFSLGRGVGIGIRRLYRR